MGSRVIIAVCALLFGWAVIAGLAYVTEQAGQRVQEVQMAQVAAESAKTFEMQAMDDVKDVAVAGFAANTAIAVSGDMAQASMTRSFATAIVGVAVALIALGWIVSRVSNKDRTTIYQQSPYYTTQDELNRNQYQDR